MSAQAQSELAAAAKDISSYIEVEAVGAEYAGTRPHILVYQSGSTFYFSSEPVVRFNVEFIKPVAANQQRTKALDEVRGYASLMVERLKGNRWGGLIVYWPENVDLDLRFESNVAIATLTIPLCERYPNT